MDLIKCLEAILRKSVVIKKNCRKSSKNLWQISRKSVWSEGFLKLSAHCILRCLHAKIKFIFQDFSVFQDVTDQKEHVYNALTLFEILCIFAGRKFTKEWLKRVIKREKNESMFHCNVSFYIKRLSSTIITEYTFKWFFSSMNSQMPHKKCFGKERFWTKFTNKSLYRTEGVKLFHCSSIKRAGVNMAITRT